MAATLLAHHTASRVTAIWAHGDPPRVHPFTLVVLQERGARSEAVPGCPYSRAHETFDVIVDLRGGREPSAPHPFLSRLLLRWPTPAPCNSLDVGSPQVFRRVRDHLEQQIVDWLNGQDPPP
ncbi:hypothetical protein DAETH_35960 (plasmid) [Deinococcus aetherius]|uniref:Uncharacterized protein n=1 Tax=Deinococcus aetherius TaxID=200252 RepID=A0ABN6RPR3_9DEIO|nr:hypothetical protein DAETH_35960 [Deinococcus aetherius]